MKYVKYLGMALAAMAFVACDDIEESDSLPQTNPQLPGVNAENVAVSAGSSTINLIDLNAADAQAVMAKVATPTDWPEGFTPSVPFMQVSASEDFANPFTVETSIGGEGEVLVTPGVFDGAIKEAFGQNPKERTLHVRFPVYAVNGEQQIRMGGPNYWYCTSTVNVTPFNPFDHVIEEAYYLVGSFCNWNPAEAVKLNHSDADQYDDPVFTTSFKVEGAGYEFAIIPASTVGAGNINAGGYGGEYEGIMDLEGNLLPAEAGQKPNAILIDEAGRYDLTVNMLELTYALTAKKYPEYLYTPGDANGWNQLASQLLPTTDGNYYNGFAHLSGSFKFTSQADWNGINYGAADTEGKLSTDGGAGNLTAPKDALYWVNVNLNPDDEAGYMTYVLNEITTLGLIGDFNSWGAQVNLTPSADFLTWSGTVELTAGGWKFRMNDNWDINLGGTLDHLTAGGDNIVCEEGGTYLVTLNFADLPTATLVKQ